VRRAPRALLRLLTRVLLSSPYACRRAIAAETDAGILFGSGLILVSVDRKHRHWRIPPASYAVLLVAWGGGPSLRLMFCLFHVRHFRPMEWPPVLLPWIVLSAFSVMLAASLFAAFLAHHAPVLTDRRSRGRC